MHSALMGGTSDLAAIPSGIVEWFEEGARMVLDALDAADPDEHLWSWSDDKTVRHYLRMVPIETAVHRWDAQLTHGHPGPIDQGLAVDGIDHSFDVMMPFRRELKNAPAGRGESFRFVQTDGPGVWTVTFPGEPTIERAGDGNADVTVSGTASDLFLFLWQRLEPGALTVEGETALLARYFELVPPV
jgi:uncharacterized protein (TIGR03083 family)